MIEGTIVEQTYIFEKMYAAGNGLIYQGHKEISPGRVDESFTALFCNAKKGVNPKFGDRMKIVRNIGNTWSTVMEIWLNDKPVWKYDEEEAIKEDQERDAWIASVKSKFREKYANET